MGLKVITRRDMSRSQASEMRFVRCVKGCTQADKIHEDICWEHRGMSESIVASYRPTVADKLIRQLTYTKA